MKKKIFETNCRFDVFKKCTAHFHYWWAIFSASRMKALLVLKDLQPNRPDKVTYLENHKKTGLWPWTQLSASPRTVLFRWKSVIDHIDHAAPRVRRRWTTARPRKGTPRSRGGHGSGCPCGEEYEGSLVRLRCRHRRITGGVGEWRDGLASGGSSMGAVRPPR